MLSSVELCLALFYLRLMPVVIHVGNFECYSFPVVRCFQRVSTRWFTIAHGPVVHHSRAEQQLEV